MTITFIGHGYVGLVSACVFASLGNTVYVIGRDAEKIKKLEQGNPIIFEPGLAELLKKNIEGKRILFTTSYTQAIPNSQIVFIAVGTPSKPDGEADLTAVNKTAQHIARSLGRQYTVISCKSTVPIGTNRKIYELVKKNAPSYAKFDVASCPEFLREGSALEDSFNPDRIVIGSSSKKALSLLLDLHKPIEGKRVMVSIESAEIIKYASNSILATKISFANLISFLCEKTGADVLEVLDGVGLDNRIGRMFLSPGIGYGGSCFPKDLRSLIQTGESLDIDMSLLREVEEINKQAKERMFSKIIKNCPGKIVTIWGLAFKPNTDDVREAPSLFIITELLQRGFEIKVYDPEAMDNIKKIYGDKLLYHKDPYDAVKNTHLLAILTEWNEFKQIDLQKVKKTMKKSIVVDGRNLYDPKNMVQCDFTYIPTGRTLYQDI